MKTMTKRSSGNSGSTLYELIVVLSITSVIFVLTGGIFNTLIKFSVENNQQALLQLEANKALNILQDKILSAASRDIITAQENIFHFTNNLGEGIEIKIETGSEFLSIKNINTGESFELLSHLAAKVSGFYYFDGDNQPTDQKKKIKLIKMKFKLSDNGQQQSYEDVFYIRN